MLTGLDYPRPFLKWAGGKSKLIPQYEAYLPQRFTTYYEPFLGGGALFFYLAPRLKQAVLTDLNPQLVNVYQCVRDHVELLITHLSEHQGQHCQRYFYEVRSHLPTTAVEQAARLIYLNKTCYNGLYRENSKGQFNVPIGRYQNPKICDPSLLRSASQALQIAEISVSSFEGVGAIAPALTGQLATGADAFVYFDPPYHPISPTSSFTAYSRYDFKTTDQIALKETFAQLAASGTQLLLSNSDCPFIRDLYQDFTIHTITARRAINSKAQNRGKITEVLVTSHRL